MTNASTAQNEDLLKAQIEGISNFNADLTHGGSAKSVMANIGAKSSDLWKVKPTDITVIEGYNPRIKDQAYYDGVQVLSEDMEKHGYMQDKPLAGFIAKQDGRDVIVLQDGHRRYAAVMLAIGRGVKFPALPMVMKERTQTSLDLTLGLLHANEGQPFNTYEKAIIAKRLKGYGWSNAEIAKEMRCTTAAVGQLLSMAGAPEAIQALVRGGLLSVTAAIDVVKTHGEKATSVATEMVSTAKAAGKTRATAKDKADGKVRRAKSNGFLLYQAVCKLFDDKAAMKVIDKDVYAELDSLVYKIENEPKKAEKKAKVPKAPKPIKTKPAAKKPAVKKVTAKKPSLARRVAKASRSAQAAA
jgi:ParB family chromosome partitioning protein